MPPKPETSQYPSSADPKIMQNHASQYTSSEKSQYTSYLVLYQYSCTLLLTSRHLKSVHLKNLCTVLYCTVLDLVVDLLYVRRYY
eukprot:COSAG05_NODE_448_length_9744_cov_49.554277_4_plen_85_part_00